MTPIIKTKCGEQNVPHLIPSIQKKMSTRFSGWNGGLISFIRSAHLILPFCLQQAAVNAMLTHPWTPSRREPGVLTHREL